MGIEAYCAYNRRESNRSSLPSAVYVGHNSTWVKYERPAYQPKNRDTIAWDYDVQETELTDAQAARFKRNMP
jgi:hypothetical protein